MTRTSIVLGLALIAISGVWLATWFGWIPVRSGSATSPSSKGLAADAADLLDKDVAVVALGQVEPAGGILNLSAIPGDRVAVVHVREGQDVKASAPLVELHSRTLRAGELEAAKLQLADAERQWEASKLEAAARVRGAELQLEQAKLGQQDVAAQEGQFRAASAALANARSRYDRMKNAARELVSPEELLQQEAALLKAEADLRSNEVLLEKARKGSDLAIQAAETELEAARMAQEQVGQSRAVDVLKIRLALAQRQYDETILSAPYDAKVVGVLTSEGETVGPAPLVQLADMGKMVVMAEVYEADVHKVQPKQQVLIASPAFGVASDGKPVRLRGTVERVGYVVAGAGLKSIDPFGPADQDVVKVRITLNPQQPQGAPRLRVANLQVSVRFLNPSSDSSAERVGRQVGSETQPTAGAQHSQAAATAVSRAARP